jgi:hypothetical protein
METSLHRTLKERYAAGGSGRLEVVVERFRVDAVDESGRLVEVQSGAMGPLRGKLRRLLPEHRIRIVKPVVLKRRVVRKSRREGPVLSARFSPKRGALLDIFDDLIGMVRVFPHCNLEIDVLGVAIEEIRIPRRRWPGYRVADRCLSEIHESATLIKAGDLWALLPGNCDGQEPFTTHDLSLKLDRPLSFAQRVAYCLRLTGAARVVGKTGNRLIYVRESTNSLTSVIDGDGITRAKDVKGKAPDEAVDALVSKTEPRMAARE